MRIAIIDDQFEIRYALEKTLESNGYETESYEGHEDGLIEELIYQNFDLLIVDARLEDGLNGINLLKEYQENKKLPPSILITAYTTPSNIIEASIVGVKEVLQKPFETDELLEIINRHGSNKKNTKDNISIFNASKENFIGSFETMKDIYKKVGIAANNNLNVLIYGKTGCGKELIANMIHNFSNRDNKPFVSLNCAAIPSELFESQLFGHEKGSFTSAEKQHIGFAEECEDGTLFLDEVGELPMAQQGKLLRFLETKQFRRVGGTREIKFKGRIISASNINFSEYVNEGLFREDLYYRLGMITIDVPTLKERESDIPELANYFINKANKELQLNITSISKEALQKLQKHEWPGNIRELRNTIYNAVMDTTTQEISKKDIKLNAVRQKNSDSLQLEKEFDNLLSKTELTNSHLALYELEKRFFHHLFLKHNQNISQMSKALQISRNTLKAKLKRYQIIDVDLN
jgi:DNA-binding NtrC family response regulator